MKYLDNQHRILRYLSKPKASGKITLAHLKGMKPIGNDYVKLVEIQKQREQGIDISEVIDYTDGEFDTEKVKQVFVKKGLINKADFDIAHQALKNENYINANKFEVESKAITLHNQMEVERKTYLNSLTLDK